MPMAVPTAPPPLRDGDRLTGDEFMRRWESMPELKHAELIDGIVSMASPVGRPHSDVHLPLATWLGYYAAYTSGCRGGLGGTWLMGPKDIPQPDMALRILPENGGQSWNDGEYTAGAPELIVEVAASSRARDLGPKLKLYERMGVREYLVALARKRQFLWKFLTPGGYAELESDADGIFRSRFFPGLWLDADALWRLDQMRIFEVLQEGLATVEHASFVARLKASGEDEAESEGDNRDRLQ